MNYLKTRKIVLSRLLACILFATWLNLRQSNKRTIAVDAGSFNTAVGTGRMISRILSATLIKHPQAQRFRLHWLVLGNAKGPLPCEIDYDRSSKQLSERSLHSGMEARLLYSNVTDAIIHKVAQEGGEVYWVKEHGASVTIQYSFLAVLKRSLPAWLGF